MDFYKILIFGILFFSGCSFISQDLYQEGYRHGIHEQVKQIASQFQGGNFPYYHWSSPIVQDVQVPAHLANGVMIPEHNELVIIKAGEWVLSPAYPIKTQQRNSDDDKNNDMDTSNITALPSGVGSAESNE